MISHEGTKTRRWEKRLKARLSQRSEKGNFELPTLNFQL
jgi:hypothetical protein